MRKRHTSAPPNYVLYKVLLDGVQVVDYSPQNRQAVVAYLVAAVEPVLQVNYRRLVVSVLALLGSKLVGNPQLFFQFRHQNGPALPGRLTHEP
jgi:hypothetical protein